MTDPLAALLHNFSPALCRHGETEECGERAKALRDAGVTLAPDEGLDVDRLRNATRKAGGWVPEDDEGRATEQEWLDEVAREYSALTPKEATHD